MKTTLLVALFLAATAAEAQTKVLRVTTLNDSGPGSLRECVAASGKRICAFEVAGRIHQQTGLKVTSGDLTIAGETAPDSVVISGAGVEIAASNVHVSHLEVRAGDSTVAQNPVDRDSLKVTGTSAAPTKNVTIDHCSISWGVDENFSTYGAVENVTVKDSIISEGLRFSIHTDPDPGIKGHSMGALVGAGSKRISFLRNLFASNKDRNIRWSQNTTGEVINNLVYNWGGHTPWNTNNPTSSATGAILQDFVGNVYIPGPDSGAKSYTFFAENLAVPVGSKFYLHDNLGPLRTLATDDEWKISNLDKAKYASAERLIESSAAVKPSSEVRESVLQEAGARPWDRNPVDVRVVESVRSDSGKLIDCVETCSTKYPTVQLNKVETGYGERPEVRRALAVASVIDDDDARQWLQGFTHGRVATPEPTVTQPAVESPAPTATVVPTVVPSPSAATATPTATGTPTAAPSPTLDGFDITGTFTIRVQR